MIRLCNILGLTSTMSAGFIIAAEQSPFAGAADFNAPALDMTPPQHITPGKLRLWQPAGIAPFEARLVGMEGQLSNNAHAIVSTPNGRLIKLHVSALSDADVAHLQQWYKQNAFTTINTYNHGRYAAKVLSATYSKSGESIIALLCAAHGTHRLICVPNKVVTEQQAKSYPGLCYVEETTLKLLRKHADSEPAPATQGYLPVARNVNQAIAYAAMRGVGIVVLFLDKKGSATDSGFRDYMQQNPGAVARWAQQYVFLPAYRHEDGTYPASVYEEVCALGMLVEQPFSYFDFLKTTHEGYLHGITFYYTPETGLKHRPPTTGKWSVYLPHTEAEEEPENHCIFHP